MVTRAGQQPALAVILVIAGAVGFVIGTGLGNASKPTPVAAAIASPSLVPATPSPSTAPSPTPSPEPITIPEPTTGPLGTPEIIFSIEGTKHQVTDTFEAKRGWQIRWQIDGDAIAVAVSGDPTWGSSSIRRGPASGVTGIAEGGTFALNIVATGPWKITVIEGEEPAPS
jgi:hypothetical protein